MNKKILKFVLTSLGGFFRLIASLDGGARPSFYSPLRMLTRKSGAEAR
jgi:hypothetical protein